MSDTSLQFTRPIVRLIGLFAALNLLLIFISREMGHNLYPHNDMIAYTIYDRNHQTSWVNLLDLRSDLEITISNRHNTEYMPRWFPDGKSLLFVSNRDGIFDLYRMYFSFGSHPQIERITTNQRVTSANIAPAGDKIAYTAINNGQVDVYIMSSDGSNITQLRSDTYPDSDPVISPNGQEIVYRSLRNGKAELYRIGVNGERYYLFSFFPLDRYSPSWSPDGSKLAFSSIETIYIQDIATENTTPVVRGIASLYVTWLLLSDELLFLSYERDQKTRFYLVNTDGTNLRRIHSYEGIAADPDWRP